MSYLIVFEGTDGSGTTTQGDRLTERLRAAGQPVLRTRQPSDLPIGKLIREALRGTWLPRPAAEPIALLFAADRADHCNAQIAPALAAGQVTVCDRYLASSLAFQVVDGEGGIDAAWLLQANRAALRPDLTLWLDVPVDEALQRIDARGAPRERFEAERTLQAVRERYAALWRGPPAALGPIVRVDGVGDADAVQGRVEAAVAAALPALQPMLAVAGGARSSP